MFDNFSSISSLAQCTQENGYTNNNPQKRQKYPSFYSSPDDCEKKGHK